MLKSSKPLGRFALVALLALCGFGAQAANPDPQDLDPEVLAKIAKEKARMTSISGSSADAGKRSQQSQQAQAECGSVAIGNVIGSNRIGFSPIDVQVVIVGDVINANNKCSK